MKTTTNRPRIRRNLAVKCECGTPSATPPDERQSASIFANGCARCLALEAEQGAANRTAVIGARVLTSDAGRLSDRHERRRNPLDGSYRMGRACDEFLQRRGLVERSARILRTDTP